MKSVPAIPTWQITFEKGRDKFALESKALETEKKKNGEEGVLIDWSQEIKRQKDQPPVPSSQY